MIPLSTRSKESIKTALAMVIVYAIALSLGWEKPQWAAITVAMVSLDTAGASINKAAMRMLGTLVAGAVALTFISLFAQERWALMVGLSLYIGLCVYMMTGKRAVYFWFVSAFVALVIIVDTTPPLSQGAFQIAVTRVEQTAMAIAVYSLISIFLWPRGSRGDLEAASRELAAVQGELYRSYRGLMAGHEAAEESEPLRMREVQLLAQVGQALGAAETDSYAVWELRFQWRRYLRLSGEVMKTLAHWRETLPQLRELELNKPLPNLDSFCAELELRFAEIARLMAGEAPQRPPEAVTLGIDRTEVRALGHFQKAAAAVAKAQLDRLEVLSRELLDTAHDMRGTGGAAADLRSEEPRRRRLTIDPDRLGATATVLATLWVAFFVWIYVDPPGHSLFVFLATLWAMIAARAGVSPTLLVPVFPIAIALGGVIYILVMPQLSGFAELGTMIFVVTFAIFYLCWAPRLRALRTAMLALFNVLLFLDNQQAYSFASYANISAALLLSIALTIVVSYIPTSPRPEKAFLRLLRRFFVEADFMLSRLVLDRDRKRGWLDRWKLIFYVGDLLALPDKLAALGRRIDYALLPGDTPEKVEALVTNLQTIAYRITELAAARELPHAEALVREFRDELRAWREVAQEQVRLWAEDPAKAIASVTDMEARLAARMETLDARIEASYRQGETAGLSERDYENFYRYLGGLRGLSEAGIDFIRIAATVDWPRWREARF